MKCPKCGIENVEFINGKFVLRPIKQCKFCGFVVSSSESDEFSERCAEMIMRHVAEYKRTGDVNSVYLSYRYFQVLLAEVDEQRLPQYPEVSI